LVSLPQGRYSSPADNYNISLHFYATKVAFKTKNT
jgi:hypothetical protein